MTPKNNILLPFKTSHAFIVGINDYTNICSLKTAANDAREMAHLLASRHGYKVHSPLINPCKKELMELFTEIMPKEIGPKDRMIFYFAGHGIALDGDKGPNGYLVPADARQSDPESLISMDELYKTISNLSCNHGLLILDCCFAGAFKWSVGYRDLVIDLPNILYQERFNRYCKEPAWQVITSSAYDQKALDVVSNQSLGMREKGEQIHSPFAQALFKGLDGAADLVPNDRGDGIITASELYVYLRKVIESQTTANHSRQTPSLINLVRHDKGEYIFFNLHHPLNLPPRPNRNPFMGLASYNEKDQEFFYGRNKVIQALKEKIKQNKLTVVCGASGTGKSSVIKAGLLPELRAKSWQILAIIRPGKNPLQTLKEKSGNFEQQLKKKGKKLIFIDQYEELITQCLQRKDRKAFEHSLVQWLTEHEELHIILSIRSDFEPLFEGKDLAPWWKKGRYVVPPFSKEEIRVIIKRPALQSVLFYEPESLIDRLEDDVSQESGALPLLSFTLSELYNSYIKSGREDRALTLADYENLGGVIGALRTKADEVYAQQTENHKKSMRRLMLRMVSLEGRELAGKRIFTKELEFNNKKETERIRDISQQLVEARLIVTGNNSQGRPYIEPAHDALIRAWARLRNWILTMGEEQLIVQKQLGEVAQQYKTQEQVEREGEDILTQPSLLWDKNPKLEQIKAIWKADPFTFNVLELDFIKKSLTRRENSLLQLETERDHAIAVALSGKALLKLSTDTTQAIRIAEMAFEYCSHPPKESEESMIQIFNSRKDNPLYQMIFRGHDKYVNAIAVSPDGNFLLTGSSDHSVRLWSFTGEELVKYEGHTRAVEAVAFSPDGKHVISGSMDHSVNIWNLTGELIQSLHGHTKGVSSLSISSSGRFIVSGSKDKTAIIWDFSSYKKHQVLQGHKAEINDVCFSPDEKSVLTGSLDTNMRLWNLERNECKIFEGHTNAVLSVNFSLDGQSIVSGSSDKTLKLWNLQGESLQTMRGHNNLVNSVLIQSDNQQIVSACSGGVCIHWDLHGTELKRMKLHHRAITALTYTTNGQLISASEDNSAVLWMNVREELIKWQHPSLVWSIAYSPNFQHPNLSSQETATGYLISGSDDGLVRLWSVEGEELCSFSGHQGSVYSVAFDPTGKYILSGGKDGNTIIWNNHGKELHRYRGKNMGVTKVAFSNDGNSILRVNMDGSIQLLSLKGTLIRSFEGHPPGLWNGFFYEKGKSILSLGPNKKLIVWDIATGEMKKTCTLNQAKTIAISPDEQFWLTGNENHTATLWNKEGEIQQIFGGPTGHLKAVEAVAFSPSGQYVLTGSLDKSIKIWDWDGQMIQSFEGHTSKIRGFAFSSDRRYLFSCGDKNLKHWWLPKRIYEWLKEAPCYALTPSERGSYNIKPIRQA